MDPPETRYARSGDIAIAYQVTGDGPFDVVPPIASDMGLAWQVPTIARSNQRLGVSTRSIRLDTRGTGMPDPVAGSGIQFRERGVAELKGVPGEWRLFAVEAETL